MPSGETNRWLKVIALPALAQALENALQTPEEKRVYEASDGRTSREVGQDAGMSHVTVLRHWKRWAGAGLVEQVAAGRYARLVSLGDVGIETE